MPSPGVGSLTQRDTRLGTINEESSRMTYQARRFGRSIRKYLRMNLPSRAWSDPPQQRHATSPSVAGAGGASNPTTSYLAAQTGQWNKVAIDLDIPGRLLSGSRAEARDE